MLLDAFWYWWHITLMPCRWYHIIDMPADYQYARRRRFFIFYIFTSPSLLHASPTLSLFHHATSHCLLIDWYHACRRLPFSARYTAIDYYFFISSDTDLSYFAIICVYAAVSPCWYATLRYIYFDYFSFILSLIIAAAIYLHAFADAMLLMFTMPFRWFRFLHFHFFFFSCRCRRRFSSSFIIADDFAIICLLIYAFIYLMITDYLLFSYWSIERRFSCHFLPFRYHVFLRLPIDRFTIFRFFFRWLHCHACPAFHVRPEISSFFSLPLRFFFDAWFSFH